MRRLALAGLVGVVLAGCGGSRGPQSFLATDPSAAAFIQWTRDGHKVRGTLSIARLAGANGTHVENQNASFTGVVNGSSVTLTFPQGFGVITNWTGEVQGDELTLTAPTTTALQTLHFRRASIGDYRAAIGPLRHRAAAARNAQAKAQAEQQAQQQEAAAEQSVDADVQSLNSDLGGLGGFPSRLQEDVAGVSNDLVSVRTDVSNAYSDMQTTFRDSGDVRCGDADTVSGDVDTVRGDLDTITGDGDTLHADIAQARSTIAAVRADLGKLRDDETSVPEYVPDAAPSDADVTDAITATRNAIAASLRKYNGIVASGQQLLAQASGYAVRAHRGC